MFKMLLQAAIVSTSLGWSGASAGYATYVAKLDSINNSSVTGTVAVFLAPDFAVGYTGLLKSLEPGLQAETCTAVNGCGVHIHAGSGCDSLEAQGGHFFADPVTSDPWVDERYSSDAVGSAHFCSKATIGSHDIAGKPFIVHNAAGSRVACGILSVAAQGTTYSSTPSSIPLVTTSAAGQVTVYNPGDGNVYMYGTARGLEPSLQSFLTPGGSDCNFTNGCGVHIHSGYDCTNSTTQGGHLYNNETISADPWALVGYQTTTCASDAYFCAALNQGTSDINGRAFVIHSNEGNRLACGLLKYSCPLGKSSIRHRRSYC